MCKYVCSFVIADLLYNVLGRVYIMRIRYVQRIKISSLDFSVLVQLCGVRQRKVGVQAFILHTG